MSFDFSVSVLLRSSNMPSAELWRAKLGELGFSFGPLGEAWKDRDFQPIDGLPAIRLDWEESPFVEEIIKEFEDQPEAAKAIALADLMVSFELAEDRIGDAWSEQAMSAVTASAVALAIVSRGVLISTVDGYFAAEDAIQAIPLPFEIHPEPPSETPPDRHPGQERLITLDAKVPPLCWDVAVGDRFQVAFLNARNKEVELATYSSAGWKVDTVAKGMEDSEVFLAGQHAELHLVSVQRRPGYVREVMYARQVHGSWCEEPVAQEFKATSFALDRTSFPIVIGLDFETQTLVSIRQTGQGWIRSTICSEWTSESTLAIGPDGTPRVCYCEDRKDGLRYAELVGDKWVDQDLVPVKSPVCVKATLAFCEEQRYVAFNHDGLLHLATAPQNGPWSVEVVREERAFISSQVPVSMHVGSDQSVSLGYVVHHDEDDSSTVRIARRTSLGWQLTDVCKCAEGWETWIGGSTAGRLCIVYRDNTSLYFIEN